MSAAAASSSNAPAGLVLLDPDPDQVAREVVAFGQTMQRLATEVLLNDLTLELDAVGSVLCHGFHPSKARLAGQFLSPALSALRGPLHFASNRGSDAISMTIGRFMRHR
jgi:hypothetical protein